MSEASMNRESWRRAWGPAMRAFGYFCAIYVLFTMFVILPGTLLGLGSIALILSIAGLVFAFFLAIFKVIDEQAPGEIPLQMV